MIKIGLIKKKVDNGLMKIGETIIIILGQDSLGSNELLLGPMVEHKNIIP